MSDAETGEKLINANIVAENTSFGTVTNSYGFFNLVVKNTDTINLSISFIGYTTQKKQIILPYSEILNFYLSINNQIDEITVSATKPIEERNEMGVVEISTKQMSLLPALGGETDIMKAYQLMPGIKTGDEGNSGLYVRGGNYDENLILLDDVPLYYVNHLGGFISVFNIDAINSTSIIKGGFPARYGGRLSSVMEVRMKDGNLKEYHGNFGIGITNTKISYEGPIVKDKSSFIFSFRALPWEILYRPLTVLATEGLSVGYNFYDLNLKLNNKINDKNHIYFSLYRGDDNLRIKLRQLEQGQKGNLTTRWGNFLLATRWNHVFASNFFCNTTLSYTKYRYKNTFSFEEKDLNNSFLDEFVTSINDLMLKSEFQLKVNSKYDIKFGYNSILHSFNPGVSGFNVVQDDTLKYESSNTYKNYIVPENILFCENEFELGKFFSANLGVHFSDYYIDRTNYYSIQPRILLNFKLSKLLSLKTSYSEMLQYVHLLSSNTVTLPMDIWIPSTNKIKPSNCQQYSVGLYKSLKNNTYELSIESYYKTSDNLISYKEGASFRGVVEDWENKLEINGIGTSFGVEFMLQKKQGKTTGWISYTLSKTNRTFENINFGKPFPYKYDRRHDISLVINHKIKDNIDFSLTWVYGSGYPFTLPVSSYKIEDMSSKYYDYKDEAGGIYIYTDKNDFRMRSYHRLDVGFNFYKEKKRGTRIWNISVYNAYNRQNPYYYYTKVINGNIKLYQQSLFPIIPSVSYSFKF